MSSVRKEISFLLLALLGLSVMGCKDDTVDLAPEPVIKSATIQYVGPGMLGGGGSSVNKSEGIIKLSFQFHDADNDLGFDANGLATGTVNYFLRGDDGQMMPVSYADTVLSEHSFPVCLLNVPASSFGKLVTIRTGKQFSYSRMLFENNSKIGAPYPYQVSHLLIRSRNKSILSDDQRPVEVTLSGRTFYAVSDTLYCQENPDATNLRVQFLEVKANNVVEEYNWFATPGASFNARIPAVAGLTFGKRIQAGTVMVTGFSASDGLIEYVIRSGDIRRALSGKKIRLRVSVVDNAHHLSNFIESNDLQF